MKILSPILAACVLCVASAGIVGCNNPHRGDGTVAAVTLTADHGTLHVGETTRVTAQTYNLAGTPTLKWSVNPNNAKVVVEGNNSQAAMFSANQPGGYIVSATTQLPDGQWVTGTTNITVNGEPMK